jgi:hypothetical protein
MKENHVFLLMHGEDGSGDGIHSIHSCLAKAMVALEELKKDTSLRDGWGDPYPHWRGFTIWCWEVDRPREARQFRVYWKWDWAKKAYVDWS